ncbi:MAG: hypothetical protein M3R51_05295 [Candidatus Eremiobacteraeota bacterium]|nr:hypothetical protein [Candidatus Eremiobacteraeota bacterium]
MGHHHVHPYALQSLAFILALTVPAVVFLLIGGAWLEGSRSERGRRSRDAVAAWHALKERPQMRLDASITQV